MARDAPGPARARASCPRSGPSSSAASTGSRTRSGATSTRSSRFPDGRLAVLFGDASGHGMAAGLVMAVTHAVFRTQLPVDPSPGAMIEVAEPRALRDGERPLVLRGRLRPPRAGRRRDGATSRAIRRSSSWTPRGASSQRLGTGSYPLGIKKNVGVRAQSRRRSRARRDAALPFRRPLRGARRRAARSSATRASSTFLFRKAGARPYEVVAALVAELDRFLGRVACDDDVSIAAIRRKTA